MTIQPSDLSAGKAIDLDAGRRAFLRTAGLATAGAAVLGMTGLPGEAQAQGITDADILNFALNLEYLEAEFYLRASQGRGLNPSDVGGVGTPGQVRQAFAGQRVAFQTREIEEYAFEIAADEEAHVRFLRSALGGAAVARPPIDLDSSFSAAASAAGLINQNGRQGETFNPFANETNFLLAAFIFEDVGVTAYKGAAASIRDPGTLTAAAGILAVEAYHAGIIRTVLFSQGLIAEANAISDARDSLDGSSDVDQGITEREGSPLPAGFANLVPTDGNGLAFSRTPQQVLNVVYLGSAPSPVSFFPIGLNGNVR